MAGKQLQPTKAVNPDAWLHLFGLGLDYYIAGRAAAMAGLAPVAGNLLHHAVEMLVKADLSKTIPLVELKARRFGHGLPALWTAFKPNHPAENLSVFDSLIDDLHRFERIRYPDAIMTEGAAIAIGWGTMKPWAKAVVGPRIPEYFLHINEVDSLVARLFLVCSANPKAFWGTLNSEATRFLEHQNPVLAEWLN